VGSAEAMNARRENEWLPGCSGAPMSPKGAKRLYRRPIRFTHADYKWTNAF